jgi:hypothetical protein
MDTNNIKKRKGGAEKNREKKLKLLEAQASSCKSIKDFFKKKKLMKVLRPHVIHRLLNVKKKLPKSN